MITIPETIPVRTMDNNHTAIAYTITCRTQNPNIRRAGRGGAAHGGAVGRGRVGQNGTPADRFAQKTTVPRTLQDK